MSLLILPDQVAKVDRSGSTERARARYQAAWDKLKTLPTGSAGRAAALAGLARAMGAAKSPAEGVKDES